MKSNFGEQDHIECSTESIPSSCARCLQCPYCREEGYSHDPVLRNVYCCHPPIEKLIATDIEYDWEVGAKPTWCPLNKDNIPRYYITPQEINEIFQRVMSK